MLEIKNLSKEFPVEKGIFSKSKMTVKAVQNVSFNLEKNKVLGLVGESGSGKSTLGKTIMKLLNPSAGQIFYDNKTKSYKQAYFSEVHNQYGYAIQETSEGYRIGGSRRVYRKAIWFKAVRVFTEALSILTNKKYPDKKREIYRSINLINGNPDSMLQTIELFKQIKKECHSR